MRLRRWRRLAVRPPALRLNRWSIAQRPWGPVLAVPAANSSLVGLLLAAALGVLFRLPVTFARFNR
jgi:hypothetical protein